MFFIAASSDALLPDQMGLIVFCLGRPSTLVSWVVKITEESADLPDWETMV